MNLFPIYLGGQRCRFCGEEITPRDRFHTLPAGKNVDYAHEKCCQLCEENA